MCAQLLWWWQMPLNAALERQMQEDLSSGQPSLLKIQDSQRATLSKEQTKQQQKTSKFLLLQT